MSKLPRVFLRTVELKDLCEFEGAEGDVYAIYSPRTYFITHHSLYLSDQEHQEILKAAVAEARAEIEKLKNEILSMRKIIWILVRDQGHYLEIPKVNFATAPVDAVLRTYENVHGNLCIEAAREGEKP